MPTHENHKD